MTRRSLGQHYLVDPRVVEKMVSLARLRGSELLLEIGTGRGILTEKLAGICPRFVGYEVDLENYTATLSRLHGYRGCIRLADAFEERPQFDVLVSSLPYSRSRDFIEWISQAEYRRAVVLLQDDFVMKILSPPGSRDYRAISAIAQVSSEVEVHARVGRSAFSPPPRVGSVLATFVPRKRLSNSEVLDIKRLFSLRRREVCAALMVLGFGSGDNGYSGRRVYSLSPDEVYKICSRLGRE